MLSIYFTRDVLKFDKSNDFNELHPSNIEVILLTSEVSILLKLIISKSSQFINILFIDVTKEVSKLDKSISIIPSESVKNLSHLVNFSSHSNVILLIPSFSK